ncbi:hypothetical protein Tco_0786875, partial [Tanacetum coccineum]
MQYKQVQIQTDADSDICRFRHMQIQTDPDRCIAHNHTNTEMNESKTGRQQTRADRSGRCIAHNYINTKMNKSRTGSSRQSSRFRQTAANSDKQQTDSRQNNSRSRSRFRQNDPDNIRAKPDGCRSKHNREKLDRIRHMRTRRSYFKNSIVVLHSFIQLASQMHKFSLSATAEGDGNGQSEEYERPGVIISNHVSHMDILYHMSSSFPSFVAK